MVGICVLTGLISMCIQWSANSEKLCESVNSIALRISCFSADLTNHYRKSIKFTAPIYTATGLCLYSFLLPIGNILQQQQLSMFLLVFRLEILSIDTLQGHEKTEPSKSRELLNLLTGNIKSFSHMWSQLMSVQPPIDSFTFDQF